MRSACSIVLIATLSFTASPRGQSRPQQEERPQFRTGVELVQLDVSVLDRERRPIAGLTADDFTLLENGRRRPIRTFAAIQLPARPQSPERPPSVAAVPDVATNRSGGQEDRLVVILMDRTITTGEPTVSARKIAAAAVDALGPNDLAAVVSTSGGVPQNLTADRARLMAAIEQRDWSTGLSEDQEAITAKFVGKDDPLADGRCLCGLCVLQTVTRIATAVQHAPRRHKMLLFIGSSIIAQAAPRDAKADVGCERPLEDARRAMEASLALSHLTVHSVDPSGLVNVGPHTRGSAFGLQPGNDRFRTVRQVQDETSDRLQAQGSLDYLPELTGGRRVINTNGPDQKIPAIFDESSAYYLLAFESEMPPGSTRMSSIEVKVSRPAAKVYTQRRYRAALPERTAPTQAAATQSAPLIAALRGLFPVATRPLTLAVAAFPGSATKATVVVNVDVGGFARDTSSFPLDFALSAVDQTGREIGSSTKSMTVVFNPAAGAGPAETNVQTSFELPPGDYEIRMAVGDPAMAAVASVFSPLRIPQFADEPLSLSDVIIEASGGAPQSSAPREIVLSPTTRRVFERAELVRAVAEIYQGRVQTPIVPATLRTRILDSHSRPVHDQRRVLSEADFTSRKASVVADLNGLSPGEYVLTIDASSDAHSVRRTIPFAVR